MSTQLQPSNDATLDELVQLTQLCKASADSLRLMILRVLKDNAYAVQELCTILDIKQSSMSHHLKILSQAHLIESKREGNTLFYRRQARRSQQLFQDLRNQLFSSSNQIHLSVKSEKVIQDIRQARSQRSQAFFSANADKFRTQQDLIAEYPQYGDTVASLLDSLPQLEKTTALEIGPGEGQFLPELCTRFQNTLAVDNNAAMLEQAQAFMAPLNFSNIDWVHGDTQCAALQSLSANLVVLNMVLHHTPSPADIFQDLAKYTATNGVLIVTDLCSHQQTWAQESCGDLWLGFDTQELNDWASNAGFESQQTLYLSLLNGFRIQICQFKKT